MLKIIDIKTSKSFDSASPTNSKKMSFCLDKKSHSLKCEIPNLYKTFCENYIDPTKDSNTQFNIAELYKYFGNEKDIKDIVGNFINFPDCEFKNEYKPVEEVLLGLPNPKGDKIIKDTIDFYNQIYLLTSDNDKIYFDLTTTILVNKVEIDSYINKIAQKIINEDEKRKLKLCCMVYIITNSTILSKNMGLGDTIFHYIEFIDKCIYEASDKMCTFLSIKRNSSDQLFVEALNNGLSHSYMHCLFYCQDWDGAPIILKKLDEGNRLIGDAINSVDSNSFTQGFEQPLHMFMIPLRWGKAFHDSKITLLTAICHEIGHLIKGKPDKRIEFIDSIFQGIEKKWNDSKYSISYKEMMNEGFCDILGVKMTEYFVFDSNTFNDNQKYKEISQSFGWICSWKKSYIDAGHPHHSFRLNLLLTSERIHNFLCTYENLKIRKFTTGLNPACYDDKNYDKINEDYFKKYLKYKNKYLLLKKLI